jgi:hypothetical protein
MSNTKPCTAISYHIRLIDTPVETLNLRKVGCLDGLAVLTGWLSPNIFRHAKHFPSRQTFSLTSLPRKLILYDYYR